MNTGNFGKMTTAFLKRHGLKVFGASILTAGLFLGGCNNKLKDENQALRDQNSEFKERLTSTESEKAALATQLQQTENEKAEIARQMAIAQQNMAQQTYARESAQAVTKNFAPAASKTITLSGDTLFASGSTTLKPTAKKSIDAILPQIKSASNIRVEGYTDSDPIKHATQFKTNQALSKARAEAVTSYLVSKGISKSKITAIGMGSKDPKSTKAESRRVEIVVAE